MPTDGRQYRGGTGDTGVCTANSGVPLRPHPRVCMAEMPLITRDHFLALEFFSPSVQETSEENKNGFTAKVREAGEPQACSPRAESYRVTCR